MTHFIPYYAMYQPAQDYFSVFDSTNNVVCTNLSKEEAEFIVTACNAHYFLLDELASSLYSRESESIVPPWNNLEKHTKSVWRQKALAKAGAS